MTALAIVMVAAACGDGSDSTDEAGGSGTTSSGVSEGGTCSPGSGKTVTVDIPEFKFNPTPVKVDRCDVVVWKNTHNQAHTSSGEGAKNWSTGSIAPGMSAPEPIQFENAGTFTYICALHPFMKGEVTVAG